MWTLGRDDVVCQAKLMDGVIKQLSCLLCCSLNKGFILDSLGELIDADVYLAESSKHGLEGPDHIQSLACKGPR